VIVIRRRHATLTAVLGLLATALLATIPFPAMADTTCDRVAAAGGSDDAAGTAQAPYASVRKLAGSLVEGQTGCVRGRVPGDVWVSRSSVTLTSEPGQRGAIAGQIVIDPDAHHVTVRDLDLDSTGVGRPSPIVLGDDATFARDDITNGHTPIVCMILGAKNHDSGARADRTRIYDNRIHDCGTVDNHRHGLYVEHALDTRIVGNVIYDNADRAIQLYPDAQNTVITGNVIDGNGEGIIFSGNGPYSSSGTVVRGNVLTNPRLRAVVESWYPSGTPKGHDNVVEFNCLAGAKGTIDSANGGFTASNNLFADPQYVDRDAKDFRLREGSPCAALLAAGRAEATAYPKPGGDDVPPPPADDEPAAEEPPTEDIPAPGHDAPPPAEDDAPAPSGDDAPAPSAPAPSGDAAKAPSAPASPKGEPVEIVAPVKPSGHPARPVEPAPVAAAGPAEQPVVLQAPPRVRIGVGRRRGGRVALKIRLAAGATGPVRALIEVRVNGVWRAVATPRLVPGRTYTKSVKLSRAASRLVARASVVDVSPSVVAQFR
jgi:parallel beta helix pectate lyase-like protein